MVSICFKWFHQLLVFDLTTLTIWLEYKKVVLRSYALTKKERSIKNNFQDFKELSDYLKCGIGLGLVILNVKLWIYLGVFCSLLPWTLYLCVFLCGAVSEGGCLPKVVCVLEGLKIITFGLWFVIYVWLHNEFLVVSWGLDVALG